MAEADFELEVVAFRKALEQMRTTFLEALGADAIERLAGTTHQHSSVMIGTTGEGEPQGMVLQVQFAFGSVEVGHERVLEMIVTEKVRTTDQKYTVVGPSPATSVCQTCGQPEAADAHRLWNDGGHEFNPGGT